MKNTIAFKEVRISGITVSDLFFNSQDVEAVTWEDGHPTNIKEVAEEWLANYPEIRQYVTADELVADYIGRV